MLGFVAQPVKSEQSRLGVGLGATPHPAVTKISVKTTPNVRKTSGSMDLRLHTSTRKSNSGLQLVGLDSSEAILVGLRLP